jgi:hypothetical protein
MNGMVNGTEETIMPGPALDLLGLADIPQTVREARLRVP